MLNENLMEKVMDKHATISIDDIDINPENYRGHPAEQISALRVSLNKFGQVKSIVVQAPKREGGKFLLVAGEGITVSARLQGLKQLHADIIPADWPAEKVKAYMVADNETGRRADPDLVQLASLMNEVQAFDSDLLAAMGYSDEEFDELLKAVGAEVGSGVKLKELETKPPPKMAWALIGIPVVNYGRIASVIEKLADDPLVIVETSVNDG